MVETTAQIETHIAATREALGANLDALEQKIKSATNWRDYFQRSPMTIVGAAFAGGIVLAIATVGRPRRGARAARGVAVPSSPSRPLGHHTQEVMTMLDNIKGALVGMAATRLKDMVAEVVPGFRDEFDRRHR